MTIEEIMLEITCSVCKSLTLVMPYDCFDIKIYLTFNKVEDSQDYSLNPYKYRGIVFDAVVR